MTGGRAPALAFSTLACPEWDAETVVGRAVRFGYDGVEWRGGPDGTVRTSWSKRHRADLCRSMERAGLASIAVTAYSNLVGPEPDLRRASVDAIADHAELARDLGAGVVRIFIGTRDDEAPDPVVTERAVDGIRRALDRVRPTGVVLAVEPHDDHVRAAALRPILAAIPDPSLGVVWDIANGWAAGESPADGFGAYAGRIRYVQVKDGVGRGSAWRLVELGRGEVPIDRALTALRAWTAGRPDAPPPISVEWERAWHPELAPADVALPAARAWLVDHLGMPW